MNILVTGKNGFIGRNIYKSFKDSYNVFCVGREDLDLYNINTLRDYIINNKIDIVIHTAVIGGTRLHQSLDNELCLNNLMSFNLIKLKSLYDKLILFCSGAAFDRAVTINQCKEEDIFKRLPQDDYGLHKNVIARCVFYEKNIFNLRLFGCFGYDEPDHRLIKSCIKNLLINKSINVNPVIMDYFSINDLITLIHYIIFNETSFTDINCVYKEKRSLLDISLYIAQFFNIDNNLVIQKNNLTTHYTGDSSTLQNLNINLLGFKGSLNNILKKYV